MKVCTQCASLTNRSVKINREFVCQECYLKMFRAKKRKLKIDSEYAMHKYTFGA